MRVPQILRRCSNQSAVASDRHTPCSAPTRHASRSILTDRTTNVVVLRHAVDLADLVQQRVEARGGRRAKQRDVVELAADRMKLQEFRKRARRPITSRADLGSTVRPHVGAYALAGLSLPRRTV